MVKSSVQSERKTANSFLFAVLAKAADGQYRHTLRGGFFQKCLKSSPRRGLIIFFPNIYYYPNKKARTGYGLFLYCFLSASDNALFNFLLGKKIINKYRYPGYLPPILPFRLFSPPPVGSSVRVLSPFSAFRYTLSSAAGSDRTAVPKPA